VCVGTGVGPLGTSEQTSTTRYEDEARVPRAAGAKGTNGPNLEVVGSEPARMPRQARLPERGARRRNARQLAGALAAL
jgi:hypothetical protein